MKLILLAAIVVVLFISGCATQQTQPTNTSSPKLSPVQTGDVKHYSIKSQEPPISLVTDIESVVSQIADCYYKTSKKTLTVTSGTRGSASQAQAMFDKLKLGDNLDIYSNKAARDQIKKAYDDSVAEGKGNSEIVADMAAAIENQITAGIYISNHLRSGAVDFSQNGMTTSDKSAFEQCANSVNGVTRVIDEGEPVHYHLEIETASNVEEPTQSPIEITPSSSPTPTSTVEPTVSITPTPTPSPRIASSATITSFVCTAKSNGVVITSFVYSASGTATGNVGDGLSGGGYGKFITSQWMGTPSHGGGRLDGEPDTTSWTYQEESGSNIGEKQANLVKDFRVSIGGSSTSATTTCIISHE